MPIKTIAFWNKAIACQKYFQVKKNKIILFKESKNFNRCTSTQTNFLLFRL